MPVRIGAIAVGGKGSRFGHSYLQKCLVPIEDKPILEYTIDAFVDRGIKIIFFLTGFLHEQISTYLIQRYGTEAKFIPAVVFGGTTGIAPALSTLRHFVDEDFLFACGDSILRHNAFNQLLQQAEKLPDNPAVMLVSRHIEVAPTHAFVKIETATNTVRTVRLTKPARKPSAQDLVDIGVYYFRPTVFDFLHRVKQDQQLASFINPLKRAGETVSAIVTEEPWFSLHAPEDLPKWAVVKETILPLN